VLASESTSQRTEEDGATASSNDVTRIQQTFSRVMQKVKSAYHKELQRKKQVDLTASVDIMRTKANEEINDSESNDDDEAMQAMAKVRNIFFINIIETVSIFVCTYNI